MTHNLLPYPARLERVDDLVPEHRLFSFRSEPALVPAPGQFVELSVPGLGAFPVSVCDLGRDGLVTCCVRRAGRVTSALFGLSAGASVGLRGPFGNGFPVDAFRGRDALLVAGGLGMAPLRALLQTLLSDGARRERIILLYGSREPAALLFRAELEGLAESGRILLRFSVDFAETLPGFAMGVVCRIGLVNELLVGLELNPERTAAAVCGPPALYRCVLEELAALGLPPAAIYATLERRMRCGVGECCHCVTGGRFLCRDGPVFALSELRAMPGAI